MSLPEKIVRYDTLRVEYGKSKMCKCIDPHYEIDAQNRLVYCMDCGAIVDPLEALIRIANDTERWSKYIEELRDQRAQIDSYGPRRVVIKELERRYNRKHGLEPTCPVCGEAFHLEKLLDVAWTRMEETE